METNEKFDLWCLVELLGHQRIAGRCTEQNIAGSNMLRVDVPATNNQPVFTRFFSFGAIYAINPVTEEVASQVADRLEISPVQPWELKMIGRQELTSLPGVRTKKGFSSTHSSKGMIHQYI